MAQRHFVSLGMFIVDQFLFEDEDGSPTGKSLDPQVSPCGHDIDDALFPQLERELRLGVEELMPLSELGSG